jgi:hypothetical protein
MRSPICWRSNSAKLPSKFAINFPVELEVSKFCVTLTNATPCFANSFNVAVKSCIERLRRSMR